MRSAQIKEKSETVDCGLWTVDCENTSQFSILNSQCPAPSINVRKSPLRAVDIHAEDIPDLVPILSVVCGAAKGTSRIYGAGRLRLKESDRLAACMANLKILGIQAEYKDEILYITGGKLRGGRLNGYNDHRMVMSAAVALAASENGGVVTDGQAVAKSYPRFFEEFERLAGRGGER
jgi:3-phosphoshikimate 1-carboxyvinyltransferase